MSKELNLKLLPESFEPCQRGKFKFRILSVKFGAKSYRAEPSLSLTPPRIRRGVPSVGVGVRPVK
jgi:hypothetical protein